MLIQIDESETNVQPNQFTEDVCPVVLTAIDFNDKRFQVREKLDEDVVARYEDIIGSQGMAGFSTQPILWERPQDKKLVILDGWHRIQAAANTKQQTIKAKTLVGMTESDATLLAVKANLAHGLPLKRQEREEACLRIIKALTDKDGNQPANTLVGKHMGVSEATIREYRQALVTGGKLVESAKKIGSNGKPQAAKKARTCTPSAKTTSQESTRPAADSNIGQVATTTANSNGRAEILPAVTVDDGSSATETVDVGVPAKCKYPRIADDVSTPGYDHARDRDNERIRTLRAAMDVLDSLARCGWAEVFDTAGIAEFIGELVAIGKLALKARPGSAASKMA